MAASKRARAVQKWPWRIILARGLANRATIDDIPVGIILSAITIGRPAVFLVNEPRLSNRRGVNIFIVVGYFDYPISVRLGVHANDGVTSGKPENEPLIRYSMGRGIKRLVKFKEHLVRKVIV